HPESALHIVAIGLLWAAWELWSVRAKGWFRACAAGAGAGALALLLCAIFLLPVIEAIPQTMENLFRSAIYTKAHRSLPPEEALQRLRLNVLPFEYGDPGDSVRAASEPEYPHFDNGYAGTVVLALAILGLWRSPQREKWVLLAVLGVGVLIGNDFPPFADWLAKLPLFDVAINSRMLFAQTFALAALAALGVERLRDVVDRRRFAAVCACLAAIVGAIVLLRWDPMIASELTAEFLARHTAFLLLPLIAALLCARLVRGERALLASIVLVLIVQRTAEHGGFYPTIDAAAFYPKIEVLAGLPADGEPYRITAAGNVLWPNFATIYGLEDVRGYQAMTFNRMRQTYGFWCVPQPVWSNRIDDLGRPFLDALNVRHALASPDYHPPAWWHKVKEQPGVQLLENDRVLGRAFVPARIRLEEDDGRTLKEISEATDFRQRGWVRMRGHHGEEIPNGAGHVATIRGGLGRLAMTATMDAPGWIIISETAWKGWKAYIDQKRTPLYFGDHALLALYVPAGKHAILLSYLPRSFVLGRAITFATIAGLLVFGVARWRWKRYGVSDSTSHSR
ncbi:MAG TPA: YfhO family protein, partial [Thermoanaerobaculia bacterium]|nr:YfhO family protein [Thermoanaerobaculia bacterium]